MSFYFATNKYLSLLCGWYDVDDSLINQVFFFLFGKNLGEHHILSNISFQIFSHPSHSHWHCIYPVSNNYLDIQPQHPNRSQLNINFRSVLGQYPSLVMPQSNSFLVLNMSPQCGWCIIMSIYLIFIHFVSFYTLWNQSFAPLFAHSCHLFIVKIIST